MEQTEEMSCRRQGMGIQNQPREEILEPKDTGHSQVRKIPRGVLCGKEGSSLVLQKKKKKKYQQEELGEKPSSFLFNHKICYHFNCFFKIKDLPGYNI